VSPIRALRDRVKRRFQAAPLTVDDQTRIALFVQAVKSANALILAKIETESIEWWAWRLLHDQYYKEVELATMLARSTRWTLNPQIYLDATGTTMLLWQKAGIAQHILSPLRPGRGLLEYLGLSHAFLAEIRFCPLFPSSWDYADPFLYAITEIEQENGRQIQAQIRLLKGIEAPDVSLADREEIVERQRAVVLEVFGDFLSQLAPEER
jgi:hypothetical protein